jgi:hypothetical protein
MRTDVRIRFKDLGRCRPRQRPPDGEFGRLQRGVELRLLIADDDPTIRLIEIR